MSQATALFFYGIVIPKELVNQVYEKFEEIKDKFKMISLSSFCDSENTDEEDWGWALFIKDSVVETYSCEKIRNLTYAVDPVWIHYLLNCVKELGYYNIQEMKYPYWCFGVDFEP